MRIKQILVLVLFLISSTWAGIEDGLIAHYAFDGDASDSSGNGNDANAYNDYEYVDGVFNDAIRLVGNGHTGLSGGHVILPFIALNEFPAFTLSMWVNHQGSSSGAGDSFIRFGATTDPIGNGNIVSITWEADNSYLTFNVGEPVNNDGVTIPYPSDFMGSWNHLALRADNGIMTAFVNGQSVGTNSYQNFGSMSPVAGLGCSWFNSGGTESNRFIGTMDEVRIYDRALTNDEVLLLTPEPATFLLLGLGGILLRRRFH